MKYDLSTLAESSAARKAETTAIKKDMVKQNLPALNNQIKNTSDYSARKGLLKTAKTNAIRATKGDQGYGQSHMNRALAAIKTPGIVQMGKSWHQDPNITVKGKYTSKPTMVLGK